MVSRGMSVFYAYETQMSKINWLKCGKKKTPSTLHQTIRCLRASQGIVQTAPLSLQAQEYKKSTIYFERLPEKNAGARWSHKDIRNVSCFPQDAFHHVQSS
jgi:hypothetical protein